MIDFIIENPQLSVALCGLFLDLCLGLIIFLRSRKSKESDYVKLIVDEVLPGFIKLAEATELDGATKLNTVISLVMAKIRKYITKSKEQYYIAYISDRVEDILSTPQKKEK